MLIGKEAKSKLKAHLFPMYPMCTQPEGESIQCF